MSGELGSILGLIVLILFVVGALLALGPRPPKDYCDVCSHHLRDTENSCSECKPI